MAIPRSLAATAASLIVVPALALGLAPVAQAATTYTWTGEGDANSWSDADNWTPNGVPDTTDEDAVLGDGARVTSDEAVSIGKLTMEGDATLANDGGGMTTREFEFLGGRLEMKVGTGVFTALGEDEKEISYEGSVDATLTAGGQAGTITIASGTLVLSGNKEQLKARAHVKIGGRIDGRGGEPTIVIQETGCSASVPCGIIVTAPGDSYGAAIEGVTLTTAKITFEELGETLSLRAGTWAPKTPATITGGLLSTGPGYPDDEIGTTDQSVRLPATVTLDGAGWEHVSGDVLANTTLNPGSASMGEFSWKGGSIMGKLTTAKVGAQQVETILEGNPDDDLWLQNPSKAGSLLTFNGDVLMKSGTNLLIGNASSLDNKGTFTQESGTVISLDGSGKTPKVTNSGRWVVSSSDLLGEESPTIADIPFVSTGTLALLSGNLRLTYAASSLSGTTAVSVVSADSYGSIQLDDGATLRLGGLLNIDTAPSASLESGDDLLIIDNSTGSPSGLTGDFSRVDGTTISDDLGYRAALVEEGYALSVGGIEPLVLSGKALTKVKAKKPLLITYTVTNEAAIAVTPVLQLPVLKGAVISTPDELPCEESTTVNCELPEMEPGATETVEVYYTFAKTGKATIMSKVVSAGFNPQPGRATSIVRVTITR